MLLRKTTLLGIFLLSLYTHAQNTVFITSENPVEVKYLSVYEDFIVVFKINDSVRVKTKIQVDNIDSLYCNDLDYIEKAYDKNARYRKLFKKTKAELKKDSSRLAKYGDTIILARNPYKTYRYHGLPINHEKLLSLLNSKETSARYVKRAHAFRVPSYILAIAGGSMMGFPVGGAIAGKDFDLGLFGAGVGVSVVSLVFEGYYIRNLNKGIKEFNRTEKEKK